MRMATRCRTCAPRPPSSTIPPRARCCGKRTPEPAVDRQHYEGDDGRGLPRELTGLSREVVIQRADVRRASITYLRAGYKVSLSDLLHLQLIASDNAAARTLARVSRQGSTGFIVRMNEKAAELGLTNTHYADPSGLLAANVSSAYDMARLISYAGGDERITSIMQKQRHSVTAGRRTIPIHSTNQLVMKGDVDVLGGKTGFIRKAGYCFVALLRLPQGGPQVAVVVLGAKSSAGRFWETRHLFNWLASRAEDLFAAPVEAVAVAS